MHASHGQAPAPEAHVEVDGHAPAGEVVIRVLVAHADAAVRAAVCAVLRADPAIDVVGETADGRATCGACVALNPDVAAVQVRLPVLSGAGTAAWLAAECPHVRVLALAGPGDQIHLPGMRRAGAVASVPLAARPEAFTRAVLGAVGAA